MKQGECSVLTTDKSTHKQRVLVNKEVHTLRQGVPSERQKLVAMSPNVDSVISSNDASSFSHVVMPFRVCRNGKRRIQ